MEFNVTAYSSTPSTPCGNHSKRTEKREQRILLMIPRNLFPLEYVYILHPFPLRLYSNTCIPLFLRRSTSRLVRRLILVMDRSYWISFLRCQIAVSSLNRIGMRGVLSVGLNS